MMDRPSFFKVFLPSYSSERMLIPSPFVAHVKGAIPDKAFLRNCCGKCWPVEVTKVGNDLFFKDGWVKFVEENSVEFGDFLVFDYDGNYVFDFKLFGRTACQKEVVGSSGFKVKEEEKEKQKEEEEEEEEGEEEEEEETDDDNDDEDEEYKEEELEAKTLRKKTEKGKSEKSTKGLKKINQGTNYGYKGKATVKDKGGYKRTDTIGVEDDEDVFKYGMVSRPKNPYFVTKLRAKRRNELYIPVDVIRDHNLKLPQNIILLDQEGRKWSSRVVLWKDGRTWLTGGWKAFCKWNNLKWEDKCICEFIRGTGRWDIFLKMLILRAGSWLPKREGHSQLGSGREDTF